SWWTPELELQRKQEYDSVGIITEEYKHFVLGEHGVPTFSLFDRLRFRTEDYKYYRDVKGQDHFVRNGAILPINEVIDTPLLPIFPMNSNKILVGLGWDVGYSPDPTVFFI